MGNILIIKLGADGDVIRTLPVAKALKIKYPNSRIIWVTRSGIADLLKGISYIDEISISPNIPGYKYDLLFNLDIDEEASNIAIKIQADKKLGFYVDGGYPSAFNSGAQYYLDTIFDDELKKSNKKTYQEMIFEASELKYNHEHSEIALNKKDIEYAKKFYKINNLQGKKVIGIHMGASSRWPSKVWSEKRVMEFIKMAKSNGYDVLLFAGPNEIEKQKIFCSALSKEGIRVSSNDPNNTKREFASLVNLTSAMVCSDSFSLHISLSLKKSTIGLFFCTSPNEVEGYDILIKIVSSMLYDFFPQRSDEYNQELTESIGAAEVFAALEKIMKK